MLAAIGTKAKPVPPLNLVGDYAGGSLFLITGMLAALIQSQSTGKGQVVDAAITDGSASLMSMFHGLTELGSWTTERQGNLLDGGSPQYDCYETSDGKFVSVGSLEPKFFDSLLEKLGIGENSYSDTQSLRRKLEEVFLSKTQDDWCQILEGSDVCFAPVLDFQEAINHPHNRARRTFIDIDGLTQPAPAPRFSGTPSPTPSQPETEGRSTKDVLRQIGLSNGDIDELSTLGVLT